MKKNDAKALLEKYNAGTCTQEERILLEDWLFYGPFDTIDLSESEILTDLDDITKGLPLAEVKPVKLYPKGRWRAAVAAAAVMLMVGGSYFFYGQQQAKVPSVTLTQIKDVLPGGNKAVLTLANGRKITLEDAGKGQLAVEAGIEIVKTADGQLKYIFGAGDLLQSKANSKLAGGFNIISTPRGGQYQVTLPDGTKVWLNAASSLKFPASFAVMDQRRVELTGEAYFEVAKLNTSANGQEKAVPFVVNTASQEVEVLGTHFNINSYADEPYVKTTLLEGSVRVKYKGRYQLIKPNQQALTSVDSDIMVSNINPKDDVAWKNGLFSFKDADLQSVMRQISRWYDMEVSYGQNLPIITFTGKIYRNDNLNKVLESIAYLGLEFRLMGRTIIVEKK